MPAFAAPSPDAVLREASTKERELQRTKAPVDVSAFLSPVGIWEVKHLRKLSSLTALTYYMHLVTPRRLRLMHNLELVTTSRACDIRPYEHSRTAEEVGADGDGMAVSISEARQVYQALKRDGGAAQAGPNTGGDCDSSGGDDGASAGGGGSTGSSNIVTLSRDMPYQVVGSPAAGAAGPSWPIPPHLGSTRSQAGQPQTAQQGAAAAASAGGGSGGATASAAASSPPVISPPAGLPRMLRSPAEAVASKLTEAAVAASAAAAAAENFYVGLASLPIGSALVGANNRASNTLLPPSSSSSSSATGASSSASPASAAASSSPAGAGPLATGDARSTSPSPSGPAAAATASYSSPSWAAPPASASASASSAAAGPSWAAAADTAGAGGFLDGGRKATAAAIAAMTTKHIRQQSLFGFTGPALNGSSGGGMAPVTAGATSSLSSPSAAATAGSALVAATASAGVQAAQYLCPSEWFVADDTASQTRIFVIQGSDTLDHWKLNLTFDPVVFEDPELGVKVHRGVYEAALALYDRFLPLVYEHLEASPFSKIAFTGHSIGGSLATLLMLMYRIRGVLPAHSIATVYTFGAPSVFCQAQPQPQPPQPEQQTTGQSHKHHNHRDDHHGNGHVHANGHNHHHETANGHHHHAHHRHHEEEEVNGHHHHNNGHGHSHSHLSGSQGNDHINGHSHSHHHNHAGSNGHRGRSQQQPSTSCSPFSFGSSFCSCSSDDLLVRLGLPPSIVRNVLMARDVVPRAFACDYSPVADILRGWGASFKEHGCLSRNGRKHLYYFVGRMCILQPDACHTFVNNDPYHPMLPPEPEIYYLTEPATTTRPTSSSTFSSSASSPVDAATHGSRQQPQQQQQQQQQASRPRPRAVARSVMEALWELMDCPHPLETLADPGAYLASGIISRYHNPEHYTKALGRVRHIKRQAERRTEEGGGGGGGAAAAGDAAGGGSRRRASGGGGAKRGGEVGARGVQQRVKAAAGAGGGGGGGGGGGVAPWDSSDGLDHDLRGSGVYGSSPLGGGDAHTHAHACR